jgi:hypothetical protein
MKARYVNMKEKSKGAVSLFVVIFATLLITIITISFSRLMTADQQQATTADLSQSAYDSAQSGVEDAKRALLHYFSVCSGGDPVGCATVKTNLDSPQCNVGLTGIATPVNGEVLIQQTSGDKALNQAYTCVIISRNTNDYIGLLPADSSKLIPIRGVSDFDSVLVEWYATSDTQNPASVDLKPLTTPLLAQSSWSVDKPPVMRTQFMQFGNNFKLSDFDSDTSGSDANTLFLYPTGNKGVVNNTIDAKTISGRDPRMNVKAGPTAIACSGNISSGGYACRAELTLPGVVGGGNRTAFLRLTSLYNKSSYRITLKKADGTVVQFDGVQPQVDSTGRANDLFRRVQTRIELGDAGFPYPAAAVYTSGNFCKNFLITDNPGDYKDSCVEP